MTLQVDNIPATVFSSDARTAAVARQNITADISHLINAYFKGSY
jgi:hypothetical protein